MIPENYISIIEKLITKTEDGKAIWNKTSREDEFKITLGKTSITTDKWRDERGRQLLDFCVRNENGEVIDSISVFSNQENDYELLSNLHSVARRAFYKVDQALKNLNNFLDTDGVIGEDDSTF